MSRSDLVRVVRSWSSVHQVGPALLLLVVTAAGSLLFSSATVEDFGLVRLAVPVSALLLMPALGGVAAAMGTVSEASLPLPDPGRAIAARLSSALVLISISALVSLAGLLLTDDRSADPIIRNVVLHAGLALMMARLDTRLLWLPSLLLTLVAMMFGDADTGGRIASWAFVLDEAVAPWQMGVAVGAAVMGLAGLVAPSRHRLPAR